MHEQDVKKDINISKVFIVQRFKVHLREISVIYTSIVKKKHHFV